MLYKLKIFNGHHEHVTLYITARKTHTKQITSLEVSTSFSPRKTKKTERSFFNLIHSPPKSIEHLFSVADDVYRQLNFLLLLLFSDYHSRKSHFLRIFWNLHFISFGFSGLCLHWAQDRGLVGLCGNQALDIFINE